MDGQTAEVGLPSKEAAWLDGIERRANWGLTFGLVLAAVGALLLATTSASAAGGVASFLGLGLLLSFAYWRRLLPHARESLREPPLDLLLERRLQLSRTEGTPARLWALDSREHPLAWFGSMQWSKPHFLTANMVPARVYGAPASRSVVVVSCSRGLLLGRIGLSRFDENPHPVGPPRGLRWLFTPLRLPLSRD